MKEIRFSDFTGRFCAIVRARTDADVAEMIGVTRQTVCSYRNGVRIPDALVLRNIARSMDVSADYLLGLTDYPTVKQSTLDKMELSPEAIRMLTIQKGKPMKFLSKMLETPAFWELLEQMAG